MNDYLEKILEDVFINEAVDKSILVLITEIVTGGKTKADERDKKQLVRLSALIVNNVLGNIDKGSKSKPELIQMASLLLTSLDLDKPEENEHLQYFEKLVGIDSVSTLKTYYFYLALLGLLSRDIIRTRLDLKNYSYTNTKVTENWNESVISGCIDAFILLVRKDNGYQDIRTAIEIINSLKKEQSNFEEKYLDKIKGDSEKITEAYKLVGIYHISKILVETANYLTEGYNYNSNLTNIIKLHKEQAKELINPATRLSSFANIISIGCTSLQKNSIWFSTQNLGTNIEKLCKKLSTQNFIDLLPSQQEAIEKNLLDPASNVTIIQMPTSAGKTLLAEFSILQTLSLKPDSKIVYVVPTRALMNQVYYDLKHDLDGFHYIIEKTSKVNEVDPSENAFLKEEINILITTPEKLDLLIRRNHPAVSDLSLIVIDEAHNIKDGERGAKLELLLVILKRERSKAKFLLLSPFLRNADMIKQWLAEGKTAIAPIKVDWKPSEKILAGIKKEGGKYYIELLPSAHGFKYVKKSVSFELEEDMDIKSTGDKAQLFELASRYLADKDKSNLYLCWGPKSADNRAREIAARIDTVKETELTGLVSRFVEDEVGEPTILSEILKKRVAVHHSGMTDEGKLLVEYLIRKNEISHICATTTVAQGINFPISSVYIDDLRKGSQRKGTNELKINDLLNIAGRAGRTLVDTYGKVFFPFNTPKNEKKVKDLILQEASEVTSALTEIIYKSEELLKAFASNNPRTRGQAYSQNESLGAFMQYLVHLLNVVGKESTITEIDSFFKDSLGYYSLEDESKKRKFIELCRMLFNDLQSKQAGVLKFADKTGFSVPSVLKIMHESKGNNLISSAESWNPNVLFNETSQSLSQKISVIGKLREVELGSSSDEAPFNPEIIAKILIHWVNGKKINSMVNIHPAFAKDKDKINKFVKFLNGLAFKSSWGLSALEGICLGKNNDVADNSFIPSMVYFGVNTQEAVATRMIGVPRGIADNVAKLINDSNKSKSYSELRKSLNSLTSNDWQSIVPRNSKLNADEWKQVTNILVS